MLRFSLCCCLSSQRVQTLHILLSVKPNLRCGVTHTRYPHTHFSGYTRGLNDSRPTPVTSDLCNVRRHMHTPVTSDLCCVRRHMHTPVTSDLCSVRRHMHTPVTSDLCSERRHMHTPVTSDLCSVKRCMHTPVTSDLCNVRRHMHTPVTSDLCCVRRHMHTPVTSDLCSVRRHMHIPVTSDLCSVRRHAHIHTKTQDRVQHFHRHVPTDLSQCLSQQNEARCRHILQHNTTLYNTQRGMSWAAVLVSLCTKDGEPAFLFTLRSSRLTGRHKGDVSFAGGKRDPCDSDVVATALRETREELGIHVATSSVWGVMKPLRDQSGLMIAPVLANLGHLEALTFTPNPDEVEEIFTLSLAHVTRPENRGYTHFRVGVQYGYTLPVFLGGKHRVWGLTAVVLDHTLKLILSAAV